MLENKQKQSDRLQGYDDAWSGAYFVTLVTYKRKAIFGRISEDRVILNPYGEMVAREWQRTETLRQEIRLDQFIVMPDHFHAILFIEEIQIDKAKSLDVGAHGRAHLQRPPKSPGSLVAGFKSTTAKQINGLRGKPRQAVWQRNYHDRIIRNQTELDKIREYIHHNLLALADWGHTHSA